jgi:hypothetical protein
MLHGTEQVAACFGDGCTPAANEVPPWPAAPRAPARQARDLDPSAFTFRDGACTRMTSPVPSEDLVVAILAASSRNIRPGAASDTRTGLCVI